MTSAAPSPYREGRLFVYGTLMFPEVVQRLLDRPVSMRVATLRGYQRVAIDRGAGGAKGPIIVPNPGHSVDGVVLDGLLDAEQAMLHFFEEAAGGYNLEDVTAVCEDGVSTRASVYVGGPELREIVCGEWSRETFERSHLHHYLNERIPLIRQRWEEHLHES